MFTRDQVRSIVQAIYSEFAELPISQHTAFSLRKIIEIEVEQNTLINLTIFKSDSRMGNLWFDYVASHKNLWCSGFTAKRLATIRDAVLADSHIMSDLLERHSGAQLTPERMLETDEAMFFHGMGNFTYAISYKIRELILKNKTR